MHVELIGSTSAGKTTLAEKIVEAGRKKDQIIYLSDDFMLRKARLDWIKNEFIRRRVIEFIAFFVWLIYSRKYKDFAQFIIREGWGYSGSWLYKANRIRNVIRKIGIYEFISRKSKSNQIILADNEGILQGVHNLFVHQNHQVDRDKINQYAELAPIPDVVVYLEQKEDVLISRTLKRGHSRVAGESQDKVTHFIRQAIIAFDELTNVPKLENRLLILNGDLDAQINSESSENENVVQILELVRFVQGTQPGKDK